MVPEVSAGASAAKRSVAELCNGKTEPKKSGTKKTSEKSGKHKRDERRMKANKDTCGAAAYKLELELHGKKKCQPPPTDQSAT